jgi:hypothetical protein
VAFFISTDLAPQDSNKLNVVLVVKPADSERVMTVKNKRLSILNGKTR